MSANQDLLTAPIAPVLKKMTSQVMFGMVMLMSFNLIDTFFIGLLGTEPLAAISFTFPVTFTIISLSIGLGIGTSAVIAKVRGSGRIEEAKNDGFGALVLSFILVALLASVTFYFTDTIFSALGAGPELMPLIHDYMDIWYLGAVFLMSPMVGNAVLRASGDAKTPSMLMAGSGLINAILDPLLIFGLGPFPELGIKGAAIASVIAWAVGFVVIFYILSVKKKLISINFIPLDEFFVIARRILKIGLPAAGANMLTPIAMAVLTAMIAGHGNAAVAGFGVGTRIESIASMVVLALSMTLPPFISQNFGAGNWQRVEQAYKQVIRFVLLWQFAVYLLLLVTAGYIALAFGKDDPEVMSVIKLFIWTLPLGYGLQGIIILTNSSFNALHKPMSALVLSIVRLFIFYIPFAYLGSLYFGLTGLFVGALIGNVFTAIISYVWFTRSLPAKTDDEEPTLAV
ncbi:MAG: MATE family efflux transporter [Gammaproteobacteria bacterium]|nr:MATE family efflux transporter [Gammaproteobacteria bacterium]